MRIIRSLTPALLVLLAGARLVATMGGGPDWGMSGYSRSGVEGSGGNRFYAFSIDGQ